MSEETLRIDDDRYSRLRLIAWWDQERIAASRVLVVGAGALGNEVLKNLALLGIGHIFVIDFDQIEASNLTRSVLFRANDCDKHKATVAAERASELNPDCRIIPLVGNVICDLGVGFIRDIDVVIGCLDNREARLWVNRLCWKGITPWVDGGIQEINGVTKVFKPPSGACYECAMTENDYRLINLRYSCPLLRREDIVAGKVPTAPTISSIIAGLQTQEALKLLHEMPVEDGTAHVFNGIANSFYSTKFQRREDCLSHEIYDQPIEIQIGAKDNTIEELFVAAEACLGEPIDELQLDRDWIEALECRSCDQSLAVGQSVYAYGGSQSECPGCGEEMKPKLIHSLPRHSPLGVRKIIELGIPVYDIVRVLANSKEAHFLLAADRDVIDSGLFNAHPDHSND